MLNRILTIGREIPVPDVVERTDDSECHYRKAEAPVEGRFQGTAFEAWLIVQAVAWYLRYPLSYRDVDGHRKLNRTYFALGAFVTLELISCRLYACHLAPRIHRGVATSAMVG